MRQRMLTRAGPQHSYAQASPCGTEILLTNTDRSSRWWIELKKSVGNDEWLSS